MCGITGSLKVGDKDYTTSEAWVQHSLLMASALRGTDGTGIALGCRKNPDDVYTFKKAKPSYEAISRSELVAMCTDTRWMLTHCRATTVGGNSDEACHPFSEQFLIGVHNGTVHRAKTFFPGIDGINDSQVLYRALDEVEPEEAAATLAKIQTGAYALAWYDTRIRALRFARNSERPLWFAKHEDIWWWASEPSMIAFALARNSRTPLLYKDIEPWQLATNRLLTVPVNGAEAYVEKYEVERPKYIPHSGTSRYTPRSQPFYGAPYFGEDDDEDIWQTPLPFKAPEQDAAVVGWITVSEVSDVFRVPEWARKIRPAIYDAIKWLFDVPAGESIGAGRGFQQHFKNLAGWLGTEDGSANICFNAQHVSEAGLVVGAKSDLLDKYALPIIGSLTADTLASYNRAVKNKPLMDTRVPLMEGELEAVMVYHDGTLGVRVRNVEMMGWEPATVISDKERAVGSKNTHPHMMSINHPELIEWRNWS